MVIDPGYGTDQKCETLCHPSCPPTPVLFSKLSIRLPLSWPALVLGPLLRPHRPVKTRSCLCSSCFPSSKSALPSSFHHPVLIYCFGPISRVSPCTAFPTSQAIWYWREHSLLHSTNFYTAETYGFTYGRCWWAPWWPKQQCQWPCPLNTSHSIQHILLALQAYVNC